MFQKQPGYLTLSGTVAALLTILIVAGVDLVRGGILFTPGPLSAKTGAPEGGVTSHAELSNRCSSCHKAFWGRASMVDLCMACHTDMATQLKDPTSLHGIFQTSDPGLSCVSCHTEHHGANASLTNVINTRFSHENLGYSLRAHQNKSDDNPFTCADCHGQAYNVKYDQTPCINCHQQINAGFMQTHLQDYGENCLGCHDGIDSYAHAFNHSKVAFPLTGKHAPLACGQCHTGARTIADLKTTPQDCAACHQKDDTHNGQFGSDCGACHTTAGWPSATFDHNLSSFKLTGKHASVPCASCHVNNVFKGTPTDCLSCHPDPAYHAGLFGTDCAKCHTTNDWSANFTGSHPDCGGRNCLNHHRATCADCHTVNLMTATCTKCHRNNNPGGGG